MRSNAWLMAVMVAVLIGSPALAQIPAAPPKSGWIADMFAILLALCVIVVSFMGSKRGHQD